MGGKLAKGKAEVFFKAYVAIPLSRRPWSTVTEPVTQIEIYSQVEAVPNRSRS